MFACAGSCAIAKPAVIDAVVRAAVPDALSRFASGGSRVEARGERIILSNGYLEAEISASTGIVLGIRNRLTGERHRIDGDRTGFSFTRKPGGTVTWSASGETRRSFETDPQMSPQGMAAVVLTDHVAGDAPATVRIRYSLAPDAFWVERQLSVEAGDVVYGTLDYGAGKIEGADVHELKLGKYDAPRLLLTDKGGVFEGVGWWFYEVADGVYRNTAMDYATSGTFEAEPWYIGVLKPESGEPYPGWLWYKTFLAQRKRTHDKQRDYVLWNARSGYDFRPITDPAILAFVDTAESIGLDGVTTGEVRGVGPESHRAASDPAARRVINAFVSKGISFGLHEGAVDASKWASEAAFREKLAEVDFARAQGIGNLSVDFLKITDRFADHRRVAEFFRHIRETMEYTECHLGMAAYGPQFQREVLVNHPTDLHGFDIGRFSSDWATITGFRKSRREWQVRYDYLMPENGLFYFCTHYSNYPRLHQDPEPQQFLFRAHAWRGLAYAFQDRFGYRDAVAAQGAFSTFHIFGYLDPDMPADDRRFTQAYLDWVRRNADVLSRGRVAIENDEVLVMSKLRDGRGGIFVINYTPGAKRFRLRFDLAGQPALSVRRVYPDRGRSERVAPDGSVSVELPGERLAIFEVGDGFNGLPPVNPSAFPIDVVDWTGSGPEHSAAFDMPDVGKRLASQADPGLPRRVEIADATQADRLAAKSAGRSLGEPPREFLDAYGFKDGKYLETWKAAPWAFADRVWFVYTPGVQPAIVDAAPSLKLNGRDISLHPRVQYEPADKDARRWTVALWFADITDACRFGGRNRVILSGIRDAAPGSCYVTCAVPGVTAGE